MLSKLYPFLAAGLCAISPVFADSVAPKAADDSADAELKSFVLEDGYSASLFASEENGVANPIAIRFDDKARLWVLCSLVYPQIVPGEKANDKLYILEDTDGDGRADTTKIFAENLDMPTGFALGNGGVYLGEGTDLVFLEDTDGDDKADTREVVFSGFGTGDTHQNINSLTWSPGGELLFCQGLHCFSRVETPWGIVRLNEHGVWRLRPKRRRLHAFRGCSGQNPWGIAFGQWGEPFVKGNNTEISELLPVMVPTDHYQPPLNIGATKIKSMIAEIIDSPHLPDDIQGDVLIAGYFAHDINRHGLSRDGSGHAIPFKSLLVRTPHRSFRPVDIQTGPDGALYVADWYNPIIGHYQASFRHPDRDKEHGRIWRITADGRPLAKPVDLRPLPNKALFDLLKSAPLKERERIRITLSNRNPASVIAELEKWLSGLDQNDPDLERHLFEALALSEWNEIINRPLLDRLLKAKDPLARSYAVRVAGRWHDRINKPLDIFAHSIADPDPRVRLEAVVATSYLPDPNAITVAAKALDQPTDRFLDAALKQTAHALKPNWWSALLTGELHFESPHHLAFVLAETSGADAAKTVRALLKDQTDPETAGMFLELLATIGNADDLRFAFDSAPENLGVLAALENSARIRGIRPSGELAGGLRKLLGSKNDDLRSAGLDLAGWWKENSFARRIRMIAQEKDVTDAVRCAAIRALAHFSDEESVRLLTVFVLEGAPVEIWKTALGSLVKSDLERAAAQADRLVRLAENRAHIRDIITPFLGQAGGLSALGKEFARAHPTPEVADEIRKVVSMAGRLSPEFEKTLSPERTGVALIGLPAYDATFVAELTKEATETGDPKRGAEIFAEARLTCVACHKVGDAGGILGPDLSSVGAGVPTEQIIEAILWPDRQIKEGYLATTIETKSGRTLGGYVHTEDKARVVIRDAATGALETVSKSQISKRTDAGTLMPPGLAASLKRDELRDLIRFLADLRG